MGCGSPLLRVDGKIIQQENIKLDITSHHKNKELVQAQLLINLITNIRNKIIYEYDNLIYLSGACLFKNPTITHCTRCILYKICSECQGDINKAGFFQREDPPFLIVKKEKFSKETNELISLLFDFIIKLRDYKFIVKQIDKETPKLMYIVFENNNNVSKENISKINKGIILFKELNKIRNSIIVEYKDKIFDVIYFNKKFCNEINKIGNLAIKKKLTDIYEITMLFKDIIDKKDIKSNSKEDLHMYNSINEAKKIMEKKLKNEKVGEIAGQVGQTPSAFNGGVFSMIRNLSNNVILPIAGIILTFVMCYELIQIIIEKNNLHDVDTWFFFKWVFKTFCAVLIVSNTWNIVMGIFDVAQHVVNQSAGVISGSTAINGATALGDIEAQLEAMEVGELLGIWFQSMFVGLTMNILSICIFLVVYGRMIEIYLVTSVGPIPMATMVNREWGQTGQNYLRSLFALGFQAFLIMVCVGIYAVMVQSISNAGDMSKAIWATMGYTVLLCYTLFKTGSLSKSIFGAH